MSKPQNTVTTDEELNKQWARNNKIRDENLIKGGKWLISVSDYLFKAKDSETDQILHIKKMLNMHTISVYANSYYTTEDVALERANEEGQLFPLGSK